MSERVASLVFIYYWIRTGSHCFHVLFYDWNKQLYRVTLGYWSKNFLWLLFYGRGSSLWSFAWSKSFPLKFWFFLFPCMCAQHHSDKKFTIFSFGRLCLHLSSLQAVYITFSKSNLCRHKKFVYNFLEHLIIFGQFCKSINCSFPSFRRLVLTSVGRKAWVSYFLS